MSENTTTSFGCCSCCFGEPDFDFDNVESSWLVDEMSCVGTRDDGATYIAECLQCDTVLADGLASEKEASLLAYRHKYRLDVEACPNVTNEQRIEAYRRAVREFTGEFLDLGSIYATVTRD